jgi:hypothetical protein
VWVDLALGRSRGCCLSVLRQARQKAKALGQPFVDQAVQQSRFPSSLPEMLRPKACVLNPQQQRIYEDYSHIPKGIAALLPQPGVAAGPAGTVTPPRGQFPGAQPAPTLALQVSAGPTEAFLERAFARR